MSLRTEIYESPGYSNSLMLEPHELDILKEIVNDHYRFALKKNINIDVTSEANLYHLLKLKNHSEIWKKDDRFFKQESVEVIKKFNFFSILENNFGPFYVSNKINQDGKILEDEEIYWRIVRPNEKKDIGNLHADIWFSDIYGYKEKLFSNYSTLKIWIPVYLESGLNGLAVCSDSHKIKHKYEIVDVDGRPRPKLIGKLKPSLLITQPGNIVLFGENLIHGGVVNEGNFCRISIEITLVLGKKNN